MSISNLGTDFPIINATGGTITTITLGAYRYKVHTFTSTGVLDIVVTGNASAFSRPLIEYLVIAGGGGGGPCYSGPTTGGGGGAGGYLSSVVGEMSGGGLPALSPLPAITQTLAVTVGAGGAGAAIFPAESQGFNGNNSSLGPNIVAIGGGGGGAQYNWQWKNGLAGGSGGGFGARPNDQFSWDNFTYPDAGRDKPYPRNTGTYGQGFAGGRAGYAGGGGGGAGAVGGTLGFNDSVISAVGGIGVASTINGTLTYRAGGGGGGGYAVSDNQYPGGAGGLGGGGAGGTYISIGGVAVGRIGVAGTANTGGGAGSSSGYFTTATSAAGGSGVVIVRYPIGLA